MNQLKNWQRELRSKIQQIGAELADEEPVSVSTFTDEIEVSWKIAHAVARAHLEHPYSH